MNPPPASFDAGQLRLYELLVCPRCRGSLSASHGGLYCNGCQAEWKVREGIPVLVDENRATPQSSEAVAQPKRSVEPGPAEKSRISRRRMHRNRTQLHIVTRLLSSLPASRTLMNLPCSYGRLSVPMQSASQLLIEADLDIQRVGHAVEHAMNPHRVTGLCCDAFNLPFQEDSVDGIACIRFAHHLRSESAQELLLHELLRVARGFVLFSYNELHSLPNLWRRARLKSPEGCISRHEVATVASLHNAEITRVYTTSPIGSRHAYALIQKNT